MPTLIIQNGELRDRSIVLQPGINTVGRKDYNDLVIRHGSISHVHCVIVLMEGGLILVRDLNSTNGTFVGGRQVTETVPLREGQALRLGEIELAWPAALSPNTSEPESEPEPKPEPVIAIPEIKPVEPTPEPSFLEDGETACTNHPAVKAVRFCPRCSVSYCGKCVHALRRVRGSMHYLCPTCSGECDDIGPAEEESSFFGKIKGAIKSVFKR